VWCCSGWELKPIPDDEYWKEWCVAMCPHVAITLLLLGKCHDNFIFFNSLNSVICMQASTS
jgi:hypothetical protein